MKYKENSVKFSGKSYSIYKFIYQNTGELGPSYQKTCLAFFSNSILTMKFQVKGNVGLKLKDSSIKFKYISNSSIIHKE